VTTTGGHKFPTTTQIGRKVRQQEGKLTIEEKWNYQYHNSIQWPANKF